MKPRTWVAGLRGCEFAKDAKYQRLMKEVAVLQTTGEI